MEVKNKVFKILSIVSNILLVLVIAFWLFKRAPKIYEAYALESKVAPIFNFIDLNSQASQFPKEGQKTVFIFWATWCGPCKIEMARVNQLIINKVIPEGSVIAISNNEDPKLVLSTAQERGYRFQLMQDAQNEASSYFKIAGTPTIVFLDDTRKAKWITSGISPSLEARLRGFF